VFCLRVPLANAPLQAVAPVQRSDHDHPGLGIMVVEDEPDVLHALSNLLEVWGHRVYAGTSALLACQRHIEASHVGRAPVDLILSDYRLGDGQTGADAIRRIRSYLARQVPALIITGDTSSERLREAAASGSQLLHKPLDTEQLRHAIAASQEMTSAA